MSAGIRTRPREIATSTTPVEPGGVTTLAFPEDVFSGTQWDLRRLVVADSADLFRVHCDAVIAVATPAASDARPTAVDVASMGTSIPTPFRFSRGTIVLTGADRLVVWVSGADSGRKLLAIAQIEEAFDPRYT